MLAVRTFLVTCVRITTCVLLMSLVLCVQLIGHIGLLEESYETLLDSRTHPLPSPPFINASTATPEAEIEELLRFETLRQWNFDLFR